MCFIMVRRKTDANEELTKSDSNEDISAQIAELRTLMGTIGESVKTVSESVKNLGDSLNQKVDDLTTSTDKLAERVEEVNNSIRSDLEKIESQFDADIAELKHDNHFLKETIGENKKFVEKKCGDVENELLTLHKIVAEQKKKFVSLEKSSHRNQQHGRGWNVEIDGIPANVGDDPKQLEDAVLKICYALNVDIEDYEIDKVHRLPSKQSPKPTIVRFMTRKTVELLHENKRKLKDLGDLDIEIPGLNQDSRIYIRPSLSPYFSNLAYNCRLLKKNNLVTRAKTGNSGKLSVQKIDGSFIKIEHETDLTTNFPAFGFNFDYDRSQVNTGRV